MKKYIIEDSGITNVSNITTFKRNTDESKGVLINDAHFEITDWADRIFPTDHNNPDLYIRNRSVDLFPESVANNTLITNDGLIVVNYNVGGSSVLMVVDIFEEDTKVYEDIEPDGFDTISLYTDKINPINRRMFIYNSANVADYITTSSEKLYEDDGYVHFFSQMDYDIETDEYGNYKIIKTSGDPEISDWSDFEVVEKFQFYKKQFFLIRTANDSQITSIEVEGITLIDPVVTGIGTNEVVLNLKYFINFYENDQFIRIKIKTNKLYGFIEVV
jgi:hypothetical protein